MKIGPKKPISKTTEIKPVKVSKTTENKRNTKISQKALISNPKKCMKYKLRQIERISYYGK